jgi:AraC-like DNA-binding protein
MSAAAGVSRQHLLKLFRDRHGISPTRYLYDRRLEIAADQLIHTGLSIKEIAENSGFSNPFHFSRKFKQAYDENPRNWRAKKWSATG